MTVTEHGYLYTLNEIFAEIFVGNQIFIPENVEIFYGTAEEALAAGLTFKENV